MRSVSARLTRLGLRWRLAGLVVLLMLVCLGVAFAAVYRGTGTQIRGQIDTEISGDARDFAQSLRMAHADSASQISRTAGRYIAGQPFSTSSTLLFALVPGAATATNRPELFHPERPDNGETQAEQAAENRLSAQLVEVRMGYSTLSLPDIGDLRVLERALRLPEGKHGSRVVIGVGEPLAAVAHAQSGVARAFLLAGLVALAGALFGAYLIGAFVSRPLRRMAAVAAQVDEGDLQPRIHGRGGNGEEVRVLSEAFDHMLDRLAAAFAGQRAFVADASHELRTPLTVVRGQLEVLAAQSSPSGEEVRRVERLVQAEIARIARLVDDLLLLAKSEQSQFLRIEPIDLQDFVTTLWRGMTLIARRDFQLGTTPAGTLLADPDRLAQALRNVLANAIEHTKDPDGIVRLRVNAESQGSIAFVVEDDGPGIPSDQRARVLDRFHRTDAARDRSVGGTGLGLAIVETIVQAHGGSVVVTEADEGGARIELRLPGF
jgi:signal transduction histidine kinase